MGEMGIVVIGEKMPKKLMSCVRKVKTQLQNDHPDWTGGRVASVAHAICIKTTGQKPHKDKESESRMFNVSFTEDGRVKDLNFRYIAPIKILEFEEARKLRPKIQVRDPNSILVTGTAVYETVSKNFNEYTKKELKRFARLMPGITCQKDHDESVDNIMGIVTDGWWDPEARDREGDVSYIAELDGDEPASHKVKKGYVRNVSIAGGADKILCSICGEEMDWFHQHTPGKEYEGEICKRQFKGMYPRHLGFVVTPGVEGADAQYVPRSLGEAVDNAAAYLDHRIAESYRETVVVGNDDNSIKSSDFGESYKMPNEEELRKQRELLEQKERAQYELGEAQKKNAELQEQLKGQEGLSKQLEEAQSGLKERIIADVISAEIGLKKLEESASKNRTDELRKENQDVLEAKLSVLQSFLRDTKPTSSNPGVSKSKNFTAFRFGELSDDKKRFWEREGKLQRMASMMFGELPSTSAVITLNEWDSSRGQWKTPLAELVKSTPRR